MKGEPGPPRTIPAAAAAAAATRPDAAALIERGETWSFAELHRRMRGAASAFLNRGIAKGDAVAIWAPNQREWIVAALGVQAAGAVIVPLNTRLKGREAADILRRSRTRLLFCMRDFLDTDYRALLAGEPLPDLEAVIAFDDDGPEGWKKFLQNSGGADDPAVERSMAAIGPDDPCDILFTSGTTGIPKGVVSGHGQTITLFEAWGQIVDLREGDRYLIINPFFHTFGYKAGWLACLLTGATILPLPVLDAKRALDYIEANKITFLPGPPTIYQSLLAEQREPTSLRVAVTGAATVPPSLIERMKIELGIQTVITGYGMTECGVISMCRAGDSIERIAHTCGKALPGIEIICADDQGRSVPPGERGEILVRGYGVMKGYLDDPTATAEAIDSEGWLHTGDVGTLDPDGYLQIVDRKKDMYITGGFNCYPAEIEKLLCHHPKVEAAAVIGVPDERLGEVGKAYLVLRPNHTADAKEIISWARENMANYKVPRAVEFLDTLPKNAAGKVMRIALKNAAP